MDTGQFFLLQHARLSAQIQERFSQLTDAQMRLRPHPHMNSIAWLLWHMARSEDMGINRLVANRPHVLEEEGWARRLHLSRQDMGTGMTDEEVSEFSARVDTAERRAYHAAVGRRTQEVVRGLRPEELDEVPDPAHIRQVLYEEGVLGPNAGWVAELYVGQPKGWFLGGHGLLHPRGHFSQALLVRKMQGLGSGGG